MTYRPGGGGESRRTISSVEADIRANEREKVLNKLEQLLCAHHKYVGSYRVITGTKEDIYDELFDAMQELRREIKLWEWR